VADAHQQCPARYLEFYTVVRKHALPGATIVACGPGADFTPAWNGALIRQAGKDLSYVSVHYVVTLSNLVAKPPDANTQTAIALAIPVGMANLMQPMRAQFDADPATKGRVGSPTRSGCSRLVGSCRLRAWLSRKARGAAISAEPSLARVG